MCLRRIYYLVFIAAVFLSCGRKNTYMSRNYHQLKAKYNVLYNGENYLNEGIDLLNEGYQEDYWEVLTVEPVLVQDTLMEKKMN